MTTRGSAAAEAGGVPPRPRFLDMADANRLIYMLRHGRGTGTIVQLIAAGAGEGTSSLARDLALVAARALGLPVLLLDLDPPGTRQIAALCEGFGATVAASHFLAAPSGDLLVHQLAELDTLYVSEIPAPPAAALAGWADVFPSWREAFALVLIDSPPVERSEDGILLALDVDTTLLVVEAERTRAGVARALRDRILDMGGPISGVVLNKRRSHIPDFIDRHV